MNTVAIIAFKEMQEGLRNRWVLATTLLLGALALSLTFLGSAPPAMWASAHSMSSSSACPASRSSCFPDRASDLA